MSKQSKSKKTSITEVHLTPLEVARKRLQDALETSKMSLDVEAMSLEELLIEAARSIEYMSDPYSHYSSCGFCDHDC